MQKPYHGEMFWQLIHSVWEKNKQTAKMYPITSQMTCFKMFRLPSAFLKRRANWSNMKKIYIFPCLYWRITACQIANLCSLYFLPRAAVRTRSLPAQQHERRFAETLTGKMCVAAQWNKCWSLGVCCRAAALQLPACVEIATTPPPTLPMHTQARVDGVIRRRIVERRVRRGGTLELWWKWQLRLSKCGNKCRGFGGLGGGGAGRTAGGWLMGKWVGGAEGGAGNQSGRSGGSIIARWLIHDSSQHVRRRVAPAINQVFSPADKLRRPCYLRYRLGRRIRSAGTKTKRDAGLMRLELVSFTSRVVGSLYDTDKTTDHWKLL